MYVDFKKEYKIAIYMEYTCHLLHIQIFISNKPSSLIELSQDSDMTINLHFISQLNLFSVFVLTILIQLFILYVIEQTVNNVLSFFWEDYLKNLR